MVGRVTVDLEHGLTTSPVMRIAEVSQQHKGRIRIRRVDQSEWVAGDNPMEIMLLQATRGAELDFEVEREGAGAEEAMRLLAQIVSNSGHFERMGAIEPE